MYGSLGMTTPQVELSFRALLKLNDTELETLLRRRIALCAAQSANNKSPVFMFLRHAGEITSQSTSDNKWGAYFSNVQTVISYN